MSYEKVYTVTDWYDGPRKGIADFEGEPHLYESLWDETQSDWAAYYLLEPIDQHTFRLALEDWAIWRRWETAFHGGLTTSDTHPALPEDRARHLELNLILEAKFILHRQQAIKAFGHFMPQEEADWSGQGLKPFVVKWERAT